MKKQVVQFGADETERKTRRARIEAFFQRHRRHLYLVGGVLVALLLMFIGYRYYLELQSDEAQAELFQAVYHFEADSLELALSGDGVNYGFEQIIDRYGGTKAAELSHFYAGLITLRLGRYDSAIAYLESFNAYDWLLQARAYALIGDAYMEKEAYERAAYYYDKAADYKPNDAFTGYYLKKAALAYERNKDLETALARYERLLSAHPASALKPEAQKHISRLTAEMALRTATQAP